jgi:hypothetical protein
METFLIIGWILSTLIAAYDLHISHKITDYKLNWGDSVLAFATMAFGWVTVVITIKNWIKINK